MGQKKILVNIFSNWTNFILMIGMAFFVSPIIVHSLGDENYGIWTLIVSITGYFTVLDFGVNTAIVRYISKYTAQGKTEDARSVYSTAFLLFFIIGSILSVAAAAFASFFGKIFNITAYSTTYIYMVFFIVALDLALGLLFSVLQGTMQALQEFFALNVISISANVLRNILNIVFLLHGYSLLALAVIQICMSILKYMAQHQIIKRKYKFLFFEYAACDVRMIRKLYKYSVYSFLIAIALKVLFYTDSIVIGSLVSVAEVTYYAIPATLVDYLEKLVWSIVAVLIPVISAREATGRGDNNAQLYLIGTKATFFFSLPFIIVLFVAGDDFIKLWMGGEYGGPCGRVLQILLVGYLFSLSQLVAHGILKGISKHRVLAYILCFEAGFNLVLSLMLAKPFGIYGVALGTTIPLLLCNIVFIPWYTCKNFDFDLLNYLWKSYYFGLIICIITIVSYKQIDMSIDSYCDLFIISIIIAILIWSIGFFYIVSNQQRQVILCKARRLLHFH